MLCAGRLLALETRVLSTENQIFRTKDFSAGAWDVASNVASAQQHQGANSRDTCCQQGHSHHPMYTVSEAEWSTMQIKHQSLLPDCPKPVSATKKMSRSLCRNRLADFCGLSWDICERGEYQLSLCFSLCCENRGSALWMGDRVEGMHFYWLGVPIPAA